MNEIIKLENVVKMCPGGQRAVNGVTLSVCKKERILICGAPGSGKTTLMRLIAGMEAPSGGRIYVCEKAVHKMDADTVSEFRNRNLGILQRSPEFMENMTVLENVAIPLTVRGVTIAEREKAANAQLKTLGLLYARNARPAQLSGFERQMASIARALIANPKILLMDDMTAGLSSKEKDQVIGIIHAIWQFGNYTIVWFTGDMRCTFHADRQCTLHQGKLQEDIS